MLRNQTKKPFVVAVCVAFNVGAFAQENPSPRSPFAYVRWKDLAEVKVRDRFYRLSAINGIPIEEIFQHCRNTYLEKWKKRFDEDMAQVLDEMNQPAGETVSLSVRDVETGEESVLTDVPMTAANRDAIMDAKYGDLDQSQWLTGAPSVERDHLTAPDPRFAFVTNRVESDKEWAAESIPADKAIEDLDDLEWHLVNRYSYLTLRDVDYRAALDTMRLGVGDGITRGALAFQVMKFLALFGDGHTRLDRWSDVHSNKYFPWPLFMPSRFPPFLMRDADGRVAACAVQKNDPYDAEHPYVTRIDGVAVADWLATARRIVPDGSPQFTRNLAALYGVFVGFVRADSGLPDSGAMTLELTSEDGSKSRNVTVTLQNEPPMPSAPRHFEARRLPGEIGYLRVGKMEDDLKFITDLLDAMKGFRDAKGLIIDVRDNKGGTREALRTLFPFFMDPDEPPFVANAAAYRLPPGRDPHRKEGYLADRYCFPLRSDFWNDAERKAIERFAVDFAPKRPLPAGQFSDWHYFVLSQRASDAYYHFDSPVVILMNAASFSATDVLLGAFKGRKGVTLMGEASGGGSGRATNNVLLLNSGLRIQFSSMASFRPDGRLYDLEGIAPDVEVKPTAADVCGATDSQLEAAVRRLGKAQ